MPTYKGDSITRIKITLGSLERARASLDSAITLLKDDSSEGHCNAALLLIDDAEDWLNVVKKRLNPAE